MLVILKCTAAQIGYRESKATELKATELKVTELKASELKATELKATELGQRTTPKEQTAATYLMTET
ncbi:hypothetical protein STEG23_011678 [Scotinomys teguina]